MDIALLMTGNELMAGDTVDSNSSMVAKALAEHGFQIAFKSTIGDDFELLCEEIVRLSSRYSVVLINGGLGPTSDDLTSAAIARACGSELVLNSEAEQQISQWCISRNIQLTDANLKQAWLPEGAAVISNPVGSAPGIGCFIGESRLIATPGVPSELRAMLAGSVLDDLRQNFPGAQGRLIRRLKFFGLGESTVQQHIDDHAQDWPKEVILGFRAGLPLLEIKLEVDSVEHLAARDHCESLLREFFADAIIGEDDDSLESLVVDLLQEKGAKLAVAESCTGGQISASITAVPNASRVFDAGIVSYANRAKIEFLDVDAKTIDQFGVVSEEVAIEMAQGALKRIGGTHAVAVSGIAGPSGGSELKPVGTVCIAWGQAGSLRSLQFVFPLGRAMFQRYVSALGLDLIRRTLLGSDALPDLLKPGGRFASPTAKA